MSFPVGKFVRKYKQYNPNEDVTYTGINRKYPSGNYEFSNISKYVQQQGHLKDLDIKQIIRWCSQGNSIYHFEKNYGNNNNWPIGAPQNLTSGILSSGLSGGDAIEELLELPGVQVQVASALMTVMRPADHAIIDDKRLRSLPIAAPSIDLQNDTERIRWASTFEKYKRSPSVYDYYIDHVKDICSRSGRTAREVDMALWAYDEDNRGAKF